MDINDPKYIYIKQYSSEQTNVKILSDILCRKMCYYEKKEINHVVCLWDSCNEDNNEN